ncbi:hypothetical protein ILUMI_19921, partial [Ignelater luminosus]
WTLVRFLFVEVNFAKYNPSRASSFIPLPPFVQEKKAVINVRNDDQRCFAWSVVSALVPPLGAAHRCTSYPDPEQVLNLGGLQFPLKLKDIKDFCRMNPDISVNVYGLEQVLKNNHVAYEVVGPLYYAMEKKR